MTNDMACPHDQLTSTVEKGVHCWKCKEPLVSFFWPISRNNTPAGALIYALMHAPQINQEPAHDHGLRQANSDLAKRDKVRPGQNCTKEPYG